MNKSVVTGIISGIAGVVLGGIGVFVYFKKIHDVNTEREYQIYDEELKTARAEVTRLQKQLTKKLDTVKEDLKSEERDYEKTVLDMIAEVEESEEDDIIDADDLPGDDIRFIGPDDYEDDDDYEKEVIKYYSKDRVILQDEQIVEKDEFVEICGNTALASFGMYGAKPNEVYVRNEHFGTDFKIVRYNLSYEMYINGQR